MRKKIAWTLWIFLGVIIIAQQTSLLGLARSEDNKGLPLGHSTKGTLILSRDVLAITTTTLAGKLPEPGRYKGLPFKKFEGSVGEDSIALAIECELAGRGRRGIKADSYEDAIKMLYSSYLNIAARPTQSFEYNGIFYFSGGTGSERVFDFSSGYLVRKGESDIYAYRLSPSENSRFRQWLRGAREIQEIQGHPTDSD